VGAIDAANQQTLCQHLILIAAWRDDQVFYRQFGIFSVPAFEMRYWL